MIRQFIRVFSLVFVATGTSCSFALDFDGIEDLPCDCLPDYVCLKGANRCVPVGSVEDFKFCTPDALDQDALCRNRSKCIERSSEGYRCLPPCTITNYATPNAGARVRSECPTGTMCWETDRGGFCDEGECSESRQDCPITQKCVAINGAGRCFTTCKIFAGNDACVGDQVCHLLLDSNITSCVNAGTVTRGNICDDDQPCAKYQTTTDTEKPMICAKPLDSDDDRRCEPICIPGSGSGLNCPTNETCLLVATGVDGDKNLGICK